MDELNKLLGLVFAGEEVVFANHRSEVNSVSHLLTAGVGLRHIVGKVAEGTG